MDWYHALRAHDISVAHISIELLHLVRFTNPDPTFVQMEGDEQIRPAGADDLFKEQEPDMFVGNGLATEAGPGRGRGRVKKAPSGQPWSIF